MNDETGLPVIAHARIERGPITRAVIKIIRQGWVEHRRIRFRLLVEVYRNYSERQSRI